MVNILIDKCDSILPLIYYCTVHMVHPVCNKSDLSDRTKTLCRSPHTYNNRSIKIQNDIGMGWDKNRDKQNKICYSFFKRWEKRGTNQLHFTI